MASYNIPVVEQFNFRNPEDCTQWIRRFKYFRREAVCHKCEKKDHFRICCRSKSSVNQLSADTPKERDAFLGAIDTVTDSTKS